MNDLFGIEEREGYRYYAQQRKITRWVTPNCPYSKDDVRRAYWESGFDLAAYDDHVGDLEDEL